MPRDHEGSRATRWAATLALAVFGGCGTVSTTGDAATGGADMSAAAVDMAIVNPLDSAAAPPDAVAPPDALVVPDAVVVPDLTVQPDLVPPVDLSPAPDLMPPCSQTMCSGLCVNLMSSGLNCGACGHSCRGAACTAGLCAPELVDSGISTAPPLALAIDSSFVYWTDGTTIYRKAIDGSGGRTSVATHSLPSGNTGYAIGDIDVDGTDVYFAANGTQPGSGGAQPQLIRVAKDGTGTKMVIATMPGGVPNQSGAWIRSVWARDPSYVYFTALQYHAGGVYSLSKTAPSLGGPLPASSGYGAFTSGYGGHIASDGLRLFMAGYENVATPQYGVAQCALPSCNNPAVQIASHAEAGGSGSEQADPAIGFDTANVYWVTYKGVIGQSPIGMHSVQFLASIGPQQLGATLAVDDNDNYLYFINTTNGALQKVLKSKSSQTPTTMVQGQVNPIGLHASAQYLYWVERVNQGKVWRVAR